MYYSLSYKSKQFFWLVAKFGIVIGCGYFCYHKLVFNQQLAFPVFLEQLKSNDILLLKSVFFLAIFTFFNWWFEILKWKSLVATLQHISLQTATVQSLASLTVSLITPNRIGEYGAKALYFDQNKRKRVFGLNLIGNMHQMLVTTCLGALGFGYLIWKQHIYLHFDTVFQRLFIIAIGILLLVGIFKYIAQRSKWLQKLQRFVTGVSLSTHRKVAMYALLRYCIFAHQFYYLLVLFNVEIPYLQAISAIATVYLIASLIPMLSIFDVVIKGTVAVWVFLHFNVPPLTILTITSLMWCFNFVIPACAGSYFVLTFHPKRNQ